MQAWVLALVWVGVVGFAAIVLSFLVYEVSWKNRRLASDRNRFEKLMGEFSDFARTARRGSGQD